LGFMADQIGLHSARNGAAMAMFLAEFQFSKSCGQVMLFFIISVRNELPKEVSLPLHHGLQIKLSNKVFSAKLLHKIILAPLSAAQSFL